MSNQAAPVATVAPGSRQSPRGASAEVHQGGILSIASRISRAGEASLDSRPEVHRSRRGAPGGYRVAHFLLDSESQCAFLADPTMQMGSYIPYINHTCRFSRFVAVQLERTVSSGAIGGGMYDMYDMYD